MFRNSGIDFSLIAYGIIGAGVVFAVQLLLCSKVKKLAVKLIPAYFIIVCLMVMSADLLGLIKYSGFISLQGIIAIALSFVSGITLVGVILAWVVYGIRENARKREV
jgi:hypothetical protein